MLSTNVFRRLGSCLWTQSRDMRVYNYSGHIVYEIFTNQGYMYVRENKDTNKIDVVRSQNIVYENVSKKQDQATLLPDYECN